MVARSQAHLGGQSSKLHAAATGCSIGQTSLAIGARGLPNRVRTAATSTLTGFTDAFKAKKPGRAKQIRDTIIGTTTQGFLGCAAAIQNFDFLADLPRLKVPTLVVCGADDQGTPPAGNKRIAELVSGGRYEEIANARHMPNIEHPDTFNRIMLGWLEARP